MNEHFPKVLFLGNGICRAFLGDEVSWNELKKKFTTNPAFDDNRTTNLPHPLDVVLRSENKYDVLIKKHKREMFLPVKDGQEDYISTLRELLSMGFDDIITTNYSYELESAAVYPKPLTETWLKCNTDYIPSADIKRAESKYLLHTFNTVKYNGHTNRIWHIHGEARKPDSIIYGHYAYGSLLNRYITFFSKRRNDYEKCQREECEIKIKSWLDSFVMGDVYALGFGFDYSEMDLWWLLNRKRNEKAHTGTFHFYEPKAADFDDKIELMKMYGAKTYDLGFRKIEKMDYKPFYIAAIKDIHSKMAEINY